MYSFPKLLIKSNSMRPCGIKDTLWRHAKKAFTKEFFLWRLCCFWPLCCDSLAFSWRPFDPDLPQSTARAMKGPYKPIKWHITTTTITLVSLSLYQLHHSLLLFVFSIHVYGYNLWAISSVLLRLCVCPWFGNRSRVKEGEKKEPFSPPVGSCNIKCMLPRHVLWRWKARLRVGPETPCKPSLCTFVCSYANWSLYSCNTSAAAVSILDGTWAKVIRNHVHTYLPPSSAFIPSISQMPWWVAGLGLRFLLHLPTFAHILGLSLFFSFFPHSMILDYSLKEVGGIDHCYK